MPRHPDDLLAQAEAFRLLFAYAADAILLVDPESQDPAWQIVACNDAAVEVYGFARDELAGRSISLLHWDLADPAHGADALEHIRRNGVLRGEAHHRGKDGATVIVEFSLAPIVHAGRDLLLATLRDITAHRRIERRLAAQHAISRALAEAGHFMDAAPEILQIIGENLDWDLAAMWCVDDEAGGLRCTAIWHAAATNAAAFDAGSQQATLPKGIGLPGEVWAHRAPRWLGDLRAAGNFTRLAAAEDAGLRSAFAFPILGRDSFFGVMEFFSAEVRPPDPELLEMVTAIGYLSGEFIERRRAEKAARASEARKGAILTAALDCIITIDQAGRIIEFNPAAEATFGYRREDVVGREMAELIIPPSHRELHRRGLAHYLATGDGPIIGQRIEMPAVRADGTEFPIDLAITRVPSDGPPLFTGFIRDITARKRAERAVHFQAQLLDIVDQAVIATDAQGVITYWNHFAERLYGWSVPEVLGRKIVDVIAAPTTHEQAEEVLARLSAGQSWAGEFLVQRRDGTTFPALVTDTPVYDDTGAFVGIVGVSVDITERKRTEEAAQFLAEASAVLASSLDYHETLASLAHLAVPRIADWCLIHMLDPEGTFRHVAVAHSDPEQLDAAGELGCRYGLDADLPEGVAKVLRSGSPVLYEHVSDKLLARLARDVEHLHRLRDVGLRSAMIVPLLVRGETFGAISLLSSESGRRFNAADLHLVQDLAYRAALAIENARLYQEAQEAVRVRDQFLSIASHELKTPVTAVMGYTQVLQRRLGQEPATSARDLRALQVIGEQSERLSRLVGSLLEVSRLETGQFTLDRRPVDLCELVSRVVDEAQATLPEHSRHTLDCFCPDGPLVIEGDALRLEQVVQNLIQNGIKYSPDGGTIRISVERRADQAIIAVSDRGIGIPQAAQPQLFQRFFRAGNAAQSNIAGMGIGLYVVREIVSRHAGAVEVESVEGEGSTFTVRLPLPASASPAPLPAPAFSPAAQEV